MFEYILWRADVTRSGTEEDATLLFFLDHYPAFTGLSDSPWNLSGTRRLEALRF